MMNNRSFSAADAKYKVSQHEQAGIRPLVFITVLLLAGLITGVVWMRRPAATSTGPRTVAADATATGGLSDATLAVLQRLNSPVEIRLYSVLNESEAAAPRRALAGRINTLLTEYERAAAGKITVKRFDSPAGSGSAAADGLEPLRLGRDNPAFLGIAVQCQGQRAVLPSLAPEWEAALEFDLSRAIARVASGIGSPGEVVMNPAPANAVSADELLRVVPEAESLPLPEATQKVKEAGLEEFKTAVTAMQNDLAQAKQRLADAQKEGPEAEQAARLNLQQLQVEQNQKLAEISSRMQGRLTALQQLKRSSP